MPCATRSRSRLGTGLPSHLRGQQLGIGLDEATAILVQGVLSSLILVGLYSQSSMANVTIFLQGGLSVVWLISGFFFFIPLVIARKKYADRYASEDFWRIPGGLTAVYAVTGNDRDGDGHPDLEVVTRGAPTGAVDGSAGLIDRISRREV